MPTCQEIMTPVPDFCETTSTIDEVCQLMKNKNIGSVPIVEGGDSRKVVGIITDRDLVMKVMAVGSDPKSTKASDVMSPNPVTCDKNDSIEQALDLMEKHQVRRIPVTKDDGDLVGIIGQADIVLRLHNTNKTEELLKEVSKPVAV